MSQHVWCGGAMQLKGVGLNQRLCPMSTVRIKPDTTGRRKVLKKRKKNYIVNV